MDKLRKIKELSLGYALWLAFNIPFICLHGIRIEEVKRLQTWANNVVLAVK